MFALGLAILSSSVAAAQGSLRSSQMRTELGSANLSPLPHSEIIASAEPRALQTADRAPRAQMPLPAGSQITLREAIAIALKNHPRAAEAAAESDAAEEQVGEARSYLGPQLSAVGEYLRSTENGIANTSYYNPGGILPRMTGRNHDLSSSDTSQSWDTSNNYAGGLALSQFLLDFGRRRGFVDERRFEAAATEEQQTVVNLELIFEVSQRYFSLLQGGHLVRVYEKAVEERKFHLHEAQVKASSGLRPQLDVYVTQAEVQRAQL
ncbi:MAG: TolC family protein, partial [Candidatus Binataceae bacterium]